MKRITGSVKVKVHMKTGAPPRIVGFLVFKHDGEHYGEISTIDEIGNLWFSFPIGVKGGNTKMCFAKGEWEWYEEELEPWADDE